MKASEQNFPAVLFIMLYKVVLTFESVDKFKILKCNQSNENYWAVPSRVLFIVLYKVAPTFESMNEFRGCDHTDENSSAVRSDAVVVFHRLTENDFDSLLYAKWTNPS